MGQGNVLLQPQSRALYDHILQRVEGRSDLPPDFEQHFTEFDGFRYLLAGSTSGPGPGSLRLSFALPDLGSQYASQVLNDNTHALLVAMYGTVAVPVEPPVQGYQVTLEIDTTYLARTSKSNREYHVKALSGIRLLIIGNPLRQHFMRLANDQCVPAAVEAHCNRPGEIYFVKPNADSITLVFPVNFVSAQDAAIGTAFLQEFVEARRGATMGHAPSCSYSKTPPLEVKDVPPEHLSQANGGFVSFTFFKRHVSGPQLEHVLWSMCTFYFLVSYHIKCCKAMLHTRMRTKVSQMLGALDLAQPSTASQQPGDLGAAAAGTGPPVTPSRGSSNGSGAAALVGGVRPVLLGTVEKAKRTASGRYFVPAQA